MIRVEGLGKRYRLGSDGPAYHTLRESLMGWLRDPLRARGPEAREVWALRDVSFEVGPGEALGVIGRNGAGKSTLLKVLSRITEPTTGRAELFGRVGSLLEVGTGFHPELTARENVYLSGAILGMLRGEIARKFDEIVGFAGVEAFVDTPVKRYSSGMYLRLAFAVAAHLEPEILLVDEVLAVGDAEFQRRCLGKMNDVARQGRTVLFVSHNLAAVRSLCGRAVLLEGGRLVYEGTAVRCTERYLASLAEPGSDEADLSARPRPPVVDTALRIDRVRVLSPEGRAVLPARTALELELLFEVGESLDGVALGVAVESLEGVPVFECRSNHSYGPLERLEPGIYSIRCRIPRHGLQPGRYALSVGARSARKYLDYVRQALVLEVLGEASGSPWFEETSGLVRVDSDWTVPAARAAALGRVGAIEG